MAAYSLSKSTYIRGLQCLKSLYLNRHRTFLRDKISVEQLAKFARGHAIGKIAHELFPGGIELPKPDRNAALKTRQLIAEGYPVLYEACFIHNGVIVALDILEKQPGGWNAYEVKSSSALSEVYYEDALFQGYVIKNTGLQLNHFYLVHRNPEVSMDEGGNIREKFLFVEVDISDDGKDREIAARIRLMQEVLQHSHSPEVKPGRQCMHPYPCDFRGFCWKNLTGEERLSILNSE